jgi:hypothetical protein
VESDDAGMLWRPPRHSNCGCVPGVIETGTEAELAAQLKAETPEETAARLAREAAAAKDSVRYTFVPLTAQLSKC